MPSYTDAERAHLKTVAADPSAATTDGTPTGTFALTLFAALALWALALATYIVTRAVLIALLAASAFVAPNQAATANFGHAGRIASLAVLVLTGATGVVSTLSGPLYALADHLRPTVPSWRCVRRPPTAPASRRGRPARRVAGGRAPSPRS
ncbi:hypothetical protein [Amycolatopsis viridis]|uniref:Uncharacterized protein n=1 Tax=Amycolatopsis viridis TaxID=185678 RepID=A0ABX0SZ07_9PSEU|nr:hypothetical protein [Amycolatopsis viridis]NIH82202.1 hypothetical protein [Amycolatopsis viridis]